MGEITSILVYLFNNASSNSDSMVPNDGMTVKNELYGSGRKMVYFLFKDAVSIEDISQDD